MPEPQIKAKLTLDTSALSSLKGGTGSNTAENIKKKKDSSNLSKMADALTGPIKTSALLTIKKLAVGLTGAAIGGAAYKGGAALADFFGVGTTEAEAFSLLHTENKLRGQTGEEQMEELIIALEKKAKDLEDAGDWEGAREVRDTLANLKFDLQSLRDKAARWDGTLEEAQKESNRTKDLLTVFGNLLDDAIFSLTGVETNFGDDTDGIKKQTDDLKTTHSLWLTDVDDIQGLTTQIKDAYQLILDGLKDQLRVKIGRGTSIGKSISPSGVEYDIGSDISIQQIQAAANAEQDISKSGVNTND